MHVGAGAGSLPDVICSCALDAAVRLIPQARKNLAKHLTTLANAISKGMANTRAAKRLEGEKPWLVELVRKAEDLLEQEMKPATSVAPRALNTAVRGREQAQGMCVEQRSGVVH